MHCYLHVCGTAVQVLVRGLHQEYSYTATVLAVAIRRKMWGDGTISTYSAVDEVGVAAQRPGVLGVKILRRIHSAAAARVA